MARMVFDTPDPGAVDARLRVGVQLDRSRVEAVARTLTVRLTYYTDRGTTRWGCEAGPGIVATDPEIIPPRSVIRFDGREWLACDTGGFSNAWLDVWVASEAEGRDLARRYGKYTEIEIMEIER
ncbi:MAG: hypothetical protein Q7O66_13775 [Dehalococcoidia bacterium]|nr:hypothetical protein [Dehalococcoidia bacterium]